LLAIVAIAAVLCRRLRRFRKFSTRARKNFQFEICGVRRRDKLLKFRMISPPARVSGAGRTQRIINLNN
jgi:hypothetical protein